MLKIRSACARAKSDPTKLLFLLYPGQIVDTRLQESFQTARMDRPIYCCHKTHFLVYEVENANKI